VLATILHCDIQLVPFIHATNIFFVELWYWVRRLFQCVFRIQVWPAWAAKDRWLLPDCEQPYGAQLLH